ncbi:MAG: FixH family protein [Burkholderiales bacterium]|nr:FixH family protein [Burkholderiales bacterium]
MTTSTARADAAPWYRHRWPWLLMAGPAIVVVAGLATLWLAVRSDDGLVADDYYKRGLAINERIERVESARTLGLAALVDVGNDGDVRVRLEAGGAAPAALRLVVAHATRAGADRRAELVRAPDGSYAGRIAPLEKGRWLLHVETDEWRLPAAALDGAARGVRLQASPRAAP